MDRPAKKPRLLQGPDGFQKSKSASRYKPPESITKFVSTFDNVPRSPAKQFKQPAPVKKRLVSTGAHERPRNPLVAFDMPRGPEPGPGKPSTPKQPAKPSLSTVHPHVAKADKPQPPLIVLKPPVFLPPAVPQTADVRSSVSSLNALLKQPPVPPEKPRSILKPPPVPIPPTTKPSVPLKPLAPPPPLPEHRPASPQKAMKTIFMTSVAQATDPTKEGAGAELLSLFLQQHGHAYTSSTDRELRRGVTVSPDKRSRGKDPKFVRGGLAERFQHRIACTKTDLALWRRHTEHTLASGPRVAADMQLRVLRVLDVAKPERTARAAPGPRAGLALCSLTRRPHALVGADVTLGTYVVLFHFAPTQGARSAVCTPEGFEVGRDVLVWWPWHRVALAGVVGAQRPLAMVRTLDAMMPPHSVLVLSRFCFAAPRLVDANVET